MSGATVKWYGEKYMKIVRAGMDRNLDAAAIMLQGHIKGSFGNSGVTGKRSGATKSDRAGNRSAVWGPPNVDTGHLKRNIGWKRPMGSRFTRRVGTGIGNAQSVGYAMWLEFGTRNMLPRPYLRPALRKKRKHLRRLISKRISV